MFSATIIFGPCPTPCTLNFRNLSDALAAHRLIHDAITCNISTEAIADDFGQHALFAPPIHACVVSDLDAQMPADIEKALVAARTQAKAQTAAGNDPVLRLGMMGSMQSAGQRFGQ